MLVAAYQKLATVAELPCARTAARESEPVLRVPETCGLCALPQPAGAGAGRATAPDWHGPRRGLPAAAVRPGPLWGGVVVPARPPQDGPPRPRVGRLPRGAGPNRPQAVSPRSPGQRPGGDRLQPLPLARRSPGWAEGRPEVEGATKSARPPAAATAACATRWEVMVRRGPRLCSGEQGSARRWRSAGADLAAHRLRHNFATNVRKRFGLEAAQVVLGHNKADVTQVYKSL
jgi:hypothetical protein